MHLLALVDRVDPVDDTYRRLMNRQLTVQESRHRLARAICHGGRGRIRQAYREGHDIKDEDVARLSPLKDRHINFLGRYLFNIHDNGPERGLRPLRDPVAPEESDDEE